MRFPRTHKILSKDCTCDPIFLFQRRRVVWGNHDYEHDDEGHVWEYPDDESDAVEITDKRAIDEGIAYEVWISESVFLTREEGEEWGRNHDYNYPSGWRVYCVPAKGDLVDVLANVTEGGRYR
jgi:hypothetical protein